MKIGIMQPYFLPYLGYWQLVRAVDKYVIYDDVNFIKGGWINRNRILVQERPKYINIRMDGASSFKKINEILVSSDERWRSKLLKTIAMAYSKAPFYSLIAQLIHKIIFYESDNLATYLTNSINQVCAYLHIDTEIILSSELEQTEELHGQERVIDICRQLRATEYYNAIGGQDLYTREEFASNGIELHFLVTKFAEYKQFNNPFVPALSILDIMMFNSADKIGQFLSNYTLM